MLQHLFLLFDTCLVSQSLLAASFYQQQRAQWAFASMRWHDINPSIVSMYSGHQGGLKP